METIRISVMIYIVDIQIKMRPCSCLQHIISRYNLASDVIMYYALLQDPVMLHCFLLQYLKESAHC